MVRALRGMSADKVGQRGELACKQHLRRHPEALRDFVTDACLVERSAAQNSKAARLIFAATEGVFAGLKSCCRPAPQVSEKQFPGNGRAQIKACH